jgi:hypothetical protein
VCILGEGEKKPDTGTISGSPQKKIVYAVIVVAVVILAVVLIAKFSYNLDLLDPTSGAMSIAPHQTVSTVKLIDDRAIVRPTVSFRPSQPVPAHRSSAGVSVLTRGAISKTAVPAGKSAQITPI